MKLLQISLRHVAVLAINFRVPRYRCILALPNVSLPVVCARYVTSGSYISMSNEVESVEKVKSERLLSVDALRGFNMLWIAGGAAIIQSLHSIFKNDFTAAINEQLQHAAWIGFNFEDIIMPLFMFVVGVSMVFSFEKRLQKDGRKKVYLHVVQRVGLLFILGMIYQGNLLDLKWGNLRFYSNTLQAIAAGYLGSSLILLCKNLKTQMAICGGLLGIYYLLMHFAPVPGFGAGVLTAKGNFAGYIDELVLGEHRDGSRYTWVLTSLVFTVTVMFGVFAGKILKADQSKQKNALLLLAFGIATTAAGVLLGLHDPIIKKLWSASFTLLSGGYCLLLLALFYWVIDVLQFRRGIVFFTVIGSNAIFVYMLFANDRFVNCQQIADKLVYGLQQYTGDFYPLILSSSGVAIMWLILYYMHKHKIFIKI